MLIRALTVALIILAASCVLADARSDVAKLLERTLLETDQTLSETQKFTDSHVAALPVPKSVAEWERSAKTIRTQTLVRTVFRGEAAKWRDAPLKVEWLETIPGGPGYRIKKLRYEALPGMWIPALLYEPEKITGKTPVFLNVSGHEPLGKGVDYKQIRCINLAKRGIVALSPEWFGMGQLRSDGFAHGKMNQIDLCGTSGLAPFYLALHRGIDVLLSLENADSARVGVAGLSGGGWQTILISALDPRVTLANPVAGYSSFLTRSRNFSDLGDSEQTPVDLATTADYTHLTALMAPRPTLLTYNLNDECCFKADHALPQLLKAGRPFFRLYGKDGNLRYHINAEPGDHNFQKENREALYQMIGLYFFADDKTYSAAEIPSDKEVKKVEELTVELPEKNADFNSLATALAASLPADAELPGTSSAVTKFRSARRPKLAAALRRPTYTVQDAEGIGPEVQGGIKVIYWKFKIGSDWTVPAVDLSREGAKEAVIVIADEGRTAAAERIVKLLDEGKRVLAIDPLAIGESKFRTHASLFGLLISTVGERPLGIQSAQVSAIARSWLEHQKLRQIAMVGLGPRSSLITLVTAALDEVAISGVEVQDCLGSLKESIEQNRGVETAPEFFTFGLLEVADIRQLAALIAPRPAVFVAPSERVRQEIGPLKGVYKALGKNFDPLP